MKKILLTAIIVIIIAFIINDYMLKFRPVIRPFRRRKCDKFGCGSFGASRDGGARSHAGMDVLSEVGSPVFAPFGGTVRVFQAYKNYGGLLGIEVKGKAYSCKIMYVNHIPELKTGDKVRAGQMIGYAQSLQEKYPGISNHLHVEVLYGGIHRNPTGFFPPDAIV